jgi:hypothetical protein
MDRIDADETITDYERIIIFEQLTENYTHIHGVDEKGDELRLIMLFYQI